MGIFRFIKNAVEANVGEDLADQYYQQGCQFYERACRELPVDALPVERCSRAYDIFLKEERRSTIAARLLIPPPFHGAIAQFACLPHPLCGEALSLFLMHERYPIIERRFPKFERRLTEIVYDIFAAYQLADWETLNAMFRNANPRYPVDSPFPGVYMLHDKEKGSA